MYNLSPKQVKAATLIGNGESHKNAGKEVGVSPQTISGWLQDAEFKDLVDDTKKEVMETTRDMLRGNLPLAVECLQKIMEEAKNERVRLDAAKFIIENSGIILKEIGLW